jgi:hypothetical protein
MNRITISVLIFALMTGFSLAEIPSFENDLSIEQRKNFDELRASKMVLLESETEAYLPLLGVDERQAFSKSERYYLKRRFVTGLGLVSSMDEFVTFSQDGKKLSEKKNKAALMGLLYQKKEFTTFEQGKEKAEVSSSSILLGFLYRQKNEISFSKNHTSSEKKFLLGSFGTEESLAGEKAVVVLWCPIPIN